MASFTSPKTYSVGDVLSASDLNTYQRDNISDLDERLDLLESASTATVATSETTASTSYTDLSTSGPSVTLTTGTKALVVVMCRMSNSGAGNRGFMGVDISGATTSAASETNSYNMESAVAGDFYQASAVMLFGSLTAGSNTFKAVYKVSGGTGTFASRQITVIPIGE